MRRTEAKTGRCGRLGASALLLAWSFSPTQLGLAADGDGMHANQGRSSTEAHMAMPKGVIGVSLHVGAERVGDPALLYVAHVHPEGPAQRAGLVHGDEITAVDGTSVAGKTYEEVVMMIRGDVGDTVKLTVQGDTGPQDVSIARVTEASLYKSASGTKGPHEGSAR
ncbi:hypothetical protein YTPLAS18_01090 [Nitrospira sp.]|nr:hypothetical protein YTPLAS18_01090 [Nitrospira sp.]